MVGALTDAEKSSLLSTSPKNLPSVARAPKAMLHSKVATLLWSFPNTL